MPEAVHHPRVEDRSGAGEPAAPLVHALFRARASLAPGAAAVEHEGRSLTFAALQARATALAAVLRARGVGPESRVGIVLERGPDMVAAQLAVLAAGGAFLPLDPAYPDERLAWLADDAGVRVAVTRAGLRERLPAGVAAVCVDEEMETGWDGEPFAEADPDGAAYVIYTSGSTGTPKGVVVSHAALANHARAIAAAYGLGAGDRVLQFASPAFDVALEEVFPTLIAGATLVVRDERAMDSLAAFLAFAREKALTVWNLPSPWWHELVGELERSGAGVPDALRLLVVGSEAASAAAYRSWRRVAGERVAFRNAYGPTEATVTATLYAPPAAGIPADVETVPVGAPVENVRAYVLDLDGRPVADGAPGELCLGGAGVARGYLGRPGATAEKFVPDPFSPVPGARLYRTGDRVRVRGGAIEFLGRVDRQVKVRGFRIEPEEIEAVLRAHPAVREAAVVLREDGGRSRLMGYAAAEGVDGDALRAYLAGRLPAYMVPEVLVLPALPVTASGKVDRRALSALAAQARAAGEPPRGEVEGRIAAVWEEVLRVDGVGRDEPFLALGGNSLLAAQAVSRVGHAFGVEISLPALLEASTVAGLAETVRRAAAKTPPPRALAGPREGDHPLSLSQERAWFMSRLQPGNVAYQFQAAFRFTGELDVRVLERALEEMTRRHAIFRTSFPEVDGHPVQRVHAPMALHLPTEDLRGVPAEERRAETDRRIRAELERPFELEAAPLIRWRLFRIEDAVWELAHVEHHIVHDGWSFNVFLDELLTVYRAFSEGRPSPLAEPAMQFVDYAAWQQEWIGGDEAAAQLEFWRRTLAGAPPLLELPTDRPRPPLQRFRGDLRRMELSPAEADRLRELGRAHDATLFMTMLAGFALVMRRYSGQTDLCIGTGVANRRWHEVERVVGMFVNTVVLRLGLENDPTFAELVARTRRTTLAAYSRQDMPFDRVVTAVAPERSLAYSPLHQVLFSFDDARMPELRVPGLDVTVREGLSNGSAKFDMNLIIAPRGEASAGFSDGWEAGGITVLWEFDTDLFDGATVERMLEQYRRLLLAATDAPQSRASALPMLDEAGRRQVVHGWNATDADVPADATLHGLIEAQMERTPDAVAVRFEGDAVTYRELNARANRLAHQLVARGVGPETRVGLCLERSVEMVVSILAVLKSGGAYVPLDPGYPAERLAFMLADSAVPVLLTQERLRGVIPARAGMDVIAVDRVPGDEDASAENPISRVTSGNLAYVIYTSGSTGRPKGAMNAHRGVVNRLMWMQAAFGLESADVVLQKTPFSFDVSVWEFFWPLRQGATLVMAKPEGHRDPAYLQQAIADEGVTTLHFVPSMLQQFVEMVDASRCATLKLVVCSGEALPPALVDQFHDRFPSTVALHNLYGPTEAAVDVSWWPCGRDASQVIPIGRPVWNTRLYVLDEPMQPVPVGVPGELYIGGTQVGRGYHGRAALTAEKFVPDAFGRPGARLYRTGDKARWRTDGALEYLGRLDEQVKIRGFRIELGEIEAALRGIDGVRDATVVVREDEPGDRRLVAYVVGECDADRLRDALRRGLPEHMVPGAFVAMDALPLTPNGKLDRRALPAPEYAAAAGSYVAPSNPVEQVLAEIWADVLRLERVGVRENFFAIGGHSLLATRIVARVRQVLDGEISIVTLFQRPTVGELAAVLRERGDRAGEEPAIVRAMDDLSPLDGLDDIDDLSEEELDRLLAEISVIPVNE